MYKVNLLKEPNTRILYWAKINGHIDHRATQKDLSGKT
jgi:hypothetical protein